MISVIKLGGSLLETSALPACLDAAERYAGQILIVPGGGVFADQVRKAQQCFGFDDVAAHRMAILAMQQMAVLFNNIKPDFGLFDNVLTRHHSTRISIWSPKIDELDLAGVTASWDVTSDSLAAWLAGQVSAAELIIVKSAGIADQTSLADLQQQGIVDPAFHRFIDSAFYKITIINKDRFLSGV